MSDLSVNAKVQGNASLYNSERDLNVNDNGGPGNQNRSANNEGASFSFSIDKYQEAYKRWGAVSEDAEFKGLQALQRTEDDDGRAHFVRPSAKQTLSRIFAPLLHLCQTIKNLFTGTRIPIEEVVSYDFRNSIADIFGGKDKIPKTVLKSMGSHKTGHSWFMLTTCDIKKVMSSVKNIAISDSGIDDIKQRLDEVEEREKGDWAGVKNQTYKTDRKDYAQIFSRENHMSGYEKVDQLLKDRGTDRFEGLNAKIKNLFKKGDGEGLFGDILEDA